VKARLLIAALAMAGCRTEPPQFHQPMKLGGQIVPPEVLNAGRVAYLQYCRACHGETGDGKGPAAPGQRPPPRDFRQGSFKFAGVLDQKLPRDEDLVRIVRGGLHGTAMLGWDVPEQKLGEIIQYIKTLSPRWQEDDAVGEPVVPAPDPWGDAKQAEAAARGRKLYHGFAQCLNCHPAYAPRRFIDEASREILGAGASDFRPQMYLPELKDSEYGVKILSPDFLFNELRSIQPETELPDLYRIIVAGVTGAAMPAWNPVSMPDKESDIWALAWYVRSLRLIKGTPAELALRNELAEQPPFVPSPAQQ
jgi:mono/diheme cytochrome c family protein